MLNWLRRRNEKEEIGGGRMKLNSWAEFDKIRLNMKIKKVTIENRIFVRHINPDKSIGGFVEETAKVEKTSYIEFSVRVFGNARIFGDKIISILKTIQVFQYCVSITDNFIFCGCNKFTHQEVRNLIYEKSGAKEYMTEKQFEILKEIVLKAIEF